MTEKEFFSSLSKGEKRYLARFECAWCGHGLSYTGCSAIYESCTEETRIQKRKDCLKNYKPRIRKIHEKE
jgi:hypothetical protein